MTSPAASYLFALGATLSFATASLVFTEYSRRVSVLWMNAFKAVVATLALALTLLFSGWTTPPAGPAGAWMLSGLLGLNIGDLFLLAAFTRLGAARTLILFGFQPLLVGLGAYFAFGQPLDPQRFIAVVFLILCLFTLSYERYREHKKWEIGGLAFALIAVALDTSGILLSRWGFDAAPEMSPVGGHFFRCIGALTGFAVIGLVRPIGLVPGFLRWKPSARALLIGASLAGTYLSLLLYLSAVRVGHLASIAGIAITGPMFATVLESVVHRRRPSAYLLVAFGFFVIGFWILVGVAAA